MALSEQEQAALEELSYTRYWVQENLHRFAPLAQDGFHMQGHGAVFVNISELIMRRGIEEGHPFNYFVAHEPWLDSVCLNDPSLRTSLGESLDQYNPETEFVLVLCRRERSTVHRLAHPGVQTGETQTGLGDGNAEAEYRRLSSLDPWAREHPLTTPFTTDWMYRVA